MTEEFKQSLVDSIIQQRGFTPDDRITQDLLALVSESNDQLFIAKVYNELALYDKVQAQMSDDKINFENLGRAAMGQGAANPTLSTFNRALDNSVDTPSWRTGTTPAEQELAKDIYRGLDVAAGIKGPEGSEAASNYYDYLNTKLDQVIEDTGFLGVVIRPPRGEGGTIYVTEDLNEWFINNPPMAMLEGFYPSEGKSYRKYPGFAKPTILTKPAMTKNDETGYYEHTGDYLYAAESFNADGKFNTEQDIGDTFNVAVGSVKPDGTSIGDVQTLSYDELQLLEAEVALDPTKQIVHTSGNKDEAEQQLKAWLEINNLNAQAPEYDIFGGITPDYAIYKQPDLADAFIDGDPTAAEMKDYYLQVIYICCLFH
jgi:hypothetical protein